MRLSFVLFMIAARESLAEVAGAKGVPQPGIEPGTLRSSVVRSPNLAIAAC